MKWLCKMLMWNRETNPGEISCESFFERADVIEHLAFRLIILEIIFSSRYSLGTWNMRLHRTQPLQEPHHVGKAPHRR